MGNQHWLVAHHATGATTEEAIAKLQRALRDDPTNAWILDHLPVR